MNVDEVIAANVLRLREEKGLSRAELADRLGVGLHVVRDYERRRLGAQQRQFLWVEIVALCAELVVTIFELVLPPEGVDVDQISKSEVRTVRDPETGEPLGRLHLDYGHDARSELGWILFGMQPELLTPETLSELAKKGQSEIDRREELIRGISEEMLQRVKEEME